MVFIRSCVVTIRKNNALGNSNFTNALIFDCNYLNITEVFLFKKNDIQFFVLVSYYWHFVDVIWAYYFLLFMYYNYVLFRFFK